MPGANPYSLKGEIINPLARMVPLLSFPRQVYPFGDDVKSARDSYGPVWTVQDIVLDAQKTLQMRVTLQTGFTLLGITASASSTVNGGFRAQLYDLPKKRRLADRGIQQALMGGNARGGFFLREPYEFDQPNHQLLIVAQNLETVQNKVQLVLYGIGKGFLR